ncbi:hypothetical protein M406DRAFT_72735 [Cryphonectria parasitica EP155]|uniref:Chromo domain-containing protein n=1 Tax=Cryphonectria parasitica (strain ATCC 38755 / EP155) TaxID=660469 RepID=A0A9P4XXJ8_CRYP1|nr:uncharacterized protein M406DRAFT_72735 [Cryphonectria parasitica EP155]KAF3762751.1 hypothetical protein M406DRAFT_72735 [Cryphonectria parasitica EP155]
MEDEGVVEEGGAAAEVNWERFRGDLKVSKMAITRSRPSVPFEIPILPRPRPYRPGDGPPPPNIDIQLVHDSEAFIVDKIVLPIEPFTARQRRAYYIIGWPDLPAARPVIDCARALDYVSPRTLEDWEYQDFLRREAERVQAEEEARKAAVAATVAQAKGSTQTDLLPDKKNKPRRKPKHAKGLHKRPPTPQLDREQEEMLAKRKHGPSLSTPSKNRIAQLDVEIDLLEGLEEESSDGNAEQGLQTQLDNEMLGMNSTAKALDMDASGGLNPLEASVATSRSESPARASSTRRSVPRIEAIDRMADSITNRSATPAGNSTFRHSVSQAKLPTQPASSQLSQSHIQKPVSTTPIPVPILPTFTSRSNPISSSIHSSTHIRPSVEVKPTPSPSRPEGLGEPTQPPSLPLRPPAPPYSNGHGGFTTATNMFTPTSSDLPQHHKRQAENTAAAGTAADTLSVEAKKKRQKTSHKVSRSPPEPTRGEIEVVPAQQEWVVRRLEGDEVIDGVHYFKVRWEGNWPPEENPTWEPQENISAELVTKYLRSKAAQAFAKAKKRRSLKSSDGSGKPKDKKQRTLAQWATRYNSVSEAFEGRSELDENANRQGNGDAPEEPKGTGQGDDDEADEVFVVDEKQFKGQEHATTARSKYLGAQIAAQFGRRSEF